MKVTELLRFGKPTLTADDQAALARRKRISARVEVCEARLQSVEYLLGGALRDAMVLSTALFDDVVAGFAALLDRPADAGFDEVVQAIDDTALRERLTSARTTRDRDDLQAVSPAEARRITAVLRGLVKDLKQGREASRRGELATPMDAYRRRVRFQLGAAAVVVVMVAAAILLALWPARARASRVESLRLQADAQLRAGQHEAAARLHAEAIELLPDAPTVADSYNDMGWSLQQLERLPEAVEAYQKALDLRPGFKRAKANLTAVRRSLEESFDTACASALEAIRAGEHETAVGLYGQALELVPDAKRAPEAHNNLGWALQQLGRLPEAIDAYEKALELRPDFPRARSNLEALERHEG